MVARSQGFFEVNLPVDKTVELMTSALTMIQAQITMMDAKSGLISAKRSVSMKSWGEIITIWMSPTQNGTMVNIQSECSFPQIIDWGKNQQNIMELQRAFYFLLPNQTNPPVKPPDQG